MAKQTIPAGGFVGSASGALHESSKGETYPWTVQPRIHKYEDGSVDGLGHSWTTVWVAFNGLTGQEVGRYLHHEDAAATCRTFREFELERSGK